MAVQPHIPFAAVRAFNRHPIDEIGIDGAAQPGQQRNPARQKIGAPANGAARAFDAGAGRAVEPVRPIFDQRLQPQPQPHQRLAQGLQRFLRAARYFDKRTIQLRNLGLQPIARFLSAAFIAGIGQRARGAIGWRSDLIAGWIALLARLGGPADPDFVDWIAVERSDGREWDIGLHRHYLDPMKPFANSVLAPSHGVMMTSATLRDGDDWQSAVDRSGAPHLDINPRLFSADSPFDYAAQAEVLIVTDVPKGDIPALAAAYGRLIEAAGGGALGLFTAIRRLRAVYGRIADRLARGGLPLFAQHVDPIDTGTLVDIFRDDPRASLLGTDALRDGVDVPGDSLRLVVMEQVPWPKPSILHRARRMASGGSAYDDRIIRARLAQAFGRLIRSGTDKGHFVVLSSAFPSRLLSAFPAGTPIRRVTLDVALQSVMGSVSETVAAHDRPEEIS